MSTNKALFVLFLLGIGIIFPEMWGINFLHFLPIQVTVLAVLLYSALFIFADDECPPNDRDNVKLLAYIGSLALFLFPSVEPSLLGDSYTLPSSIARQMYYSGIAAPTFWTMHGGVYWLYGDPTFTRVVSSWISPDSLVVPMQLLSKFSGVMYLTLAFFFSKSTWQYMAWLCTPVMLLFFGYVEVYPIVAVGFAGSIMAYFKFYETRKKSWLFTYLFVALLTTFLHFSGVLLFVLFVEYAVLSIPKLKELIIGDYWYVAIVCVMILSLFGVFIQIPSVTASEADYLNVFRWFDIANLLLLNLTLFVLIRPKSIGMSLVCVSIVQILLFVAGLGYFRDWDAASLGFLVIPAMMQRFVTKRYIAVGIALTFLWISSNDGQAGIDRFLYRMQTDKNYVYKNDIHQTETALGNLRKWYVMKSRYNQLPDLSLQILRGGGRPEDWANAVNDAIAFRNKRVASELYSILITLPMDSLDTKIIGSDDEFRLGEMFGLLWLSHSGEISKARQFVEKTRGTAYSSIMYFIFSQDKKYLEDKDITPSMKKILKGGVGDDTERVESGGKLRR